MLYHKKKLSLVRIHERDHVESLGMDG